MPVAASHSLPDHAADQRLSDTDTTAHTIAGGQSSHPETRPKAPIATLKKRSEFLAANRGWRFACPGFVLIIHRRDDGDDAKRAGFTVTKKIGNAVVRNRIKRRLRALVQKILPEQGAEGADHVFIARRAAFDCDWDNLVADLGRGLKRFADGKESHHSSKPRHKKHGKASKKSHK
ncbi:MAG: ribonuclease P protein component [Pseudomonadota bacterium]